MVKVVEVSRPALKRIGPERDTYFLSCAIDTLGCENLLALLNKTPIENRHFLASPSAPTIRVYSANFTVPCL